MKSNRLKLAIVDSGIDRINIENVLKVYNYTNESDFDLNGHGTSVYNYILNNCPDIQVIIFKLLNRNGKSDGKAFIRILKDIINIEVDVVCMPFSFTSNGSLENINQVHYLLYELKKRGIILICPYMNGSSKSFPACDENTIGVFGGFLYNNLEYWYNKKNMVTNIYPECIRTINNKRCFFSGNSKACALATVIVINKYIQSDKNYCISNIDEELSKDTSCEKWNYQMINRDIQSIFRNVNIDTSDEIFFSDKYTILRKVIEHNLKKYVNSDYMKKKDIVFDCESCQLIHNMDSFLKGICQELSIEIYDNHIYPYDFVNPMYLLCALKRWIEYYEKNKKLY